MPSFYPLDHKKNILQVQIISFWSAISTVSRFHRKSYCVMKIPQICSVLKSYHLKFPELYIILPVYPL